MWKASVNPILRTWMVLELWLCLGKWVRKRNTASGEEPRPWRAGMPQSGHRTRVPLGNCLPHILFPQPTNSPVNHPPTHLLVQLSNSTCTHKHALQATSRETLSTPVSSNAHFHKVRHKAPRAQSNSLWSNQRQGKRLPSALTVKWKDEPWSPELWRELVSEWRRGEQSLAVLECPCGRASSLQRLSVPPSPVWSRSRWASWSEWDA